MTSDTLYPPSEEGNKICRQESIFKCMLRTFFSSLSKGVGLTLSIFTTLLFFIIILNAPSPTKNTTLTVLPNHFWITKPYQADADTLLQIEVNGVIGIAPGITKNRLFDVLQDLHNLDLKPGSLKGIILKINSPGGLSDDSDSIYRMLKETKEKLGIPIYAYVDGECCSGGMLIALAADKIIASEPSAIGHVGVIMPTTFNYYSTMQRIGVESLTLHAGKHKDELNPFRPWKENEGQPFQDIIDQYYTRFINLVALNRPKITVESLKQQGAIAYMGPQALALGYIDEINNSWMSALEKISQETNCSSAYQLIELQPNLSIADLFRSGGEVLKKGRIEHHVRVPGDLPSELIGKPLYYRQH